MKTNSRKPKSHFKARIQKQTFHIVPNANREIAANVKLQFNLKIVECIFLSKTLLLFVCRARNSRLGLIVFLYLLIRHGGQFVYVSFCPKIVLFIEPIQLAI